LDEEKFEMKILKKDLPGQTVVLSDKIPHHTGTGIIGGRVYAPVTIISRVRARDTRLSSLPVSGDPDAWWLKIKWHCPCCGLMPWGYIPEAWLETGQAVLQTMTHEYRGQRRSR
jgi:hypothetical protein